MTAAGRTERGTSLLEVLIALSLIAIGVVGMAPLFVSSLDTGSAGAEIGTLSTAATARMEILRAKPFQTLANGGSLLSNMSLFSDLSHPDFFVRWEISDGSSPTGVKKIAVRAVSKSALRGSPRSITLTTLRSR